MKDPAKTATLLRCANALVAALLMMAFLAHALLSSSAGASPGMASLLMPLMTLAAMAFTHAVISIATSALMLSDTIRPPSARKKRHLAFKWLSGIALLLAGAAHVAHFPAGMPTWIVALVLLMTLTWHSLTGMKSLVRDLGMRRKARIPLKMACCALAIAASLLLAVRHL